MNRLAGKVAVVTGGAQGIGRASAEAMAAEGARVVVADINVPGVEAVAGELAAGGAEALAVAVDVSDEAAMAALMEQAASAFGSLDILVNNAALLAVEFMRRDDDVMNLELEVWDRVIDVNLRGNMLGCKHAVPHMLAAGGGAIVNISSVAGLRGAPTRTTYGVTKAGIVNLTQSVAMQYAARGIRCNSIAPGSILTPAQLSVSSEEEREERRQQIPTARFGVPEDVAWAVVFLASDEARHITGQVLAIDGGLTARV